MCKCSGHGVCMWEAAEIPNDNVVQPTSFMHHYTTVLQYPERSVLLKYKELGGGGRPGRFFEKKKKSKTKFRPKTISRTG